MALVVGCSSDPRSVSIVSTDSDRPDLEGYELVVRKAGVQPPGGHLIIEVGIRGAGKAPGPLKGCNPNVRYLLQVIDSRGRDVPLTKRGIAVREDSRADPVYPIRLGPGAEHVDVFNLPELFQLNSRSGSEYVLFVYQKVARDEKSGRWLGKPVGAPLAFRY